MRLFPVRDDWYEWRQEPPLASTVLVRVASSSGGRLVLTGLSIEGEPTAELLRAIPVGRIEAAANAQLTVVDDAVVPAKTSRPAKLLSAAGPAHGGGGWETTDPAHAAPRPAGHEVAVPGQQIAAGVRGRPDRFYEDVARAYLDLAQASPRPVAELARANGVPPTTAHRWIKEARRRRFLPPGRPGKSG